MASALPPDEIETLEYRLAAATRVATMPEEEAVMLRDTLASCGNIDYGRENTNSISQCHNEIDRYTLEYGSNNMIDKLLTRIKTLDQLIQLEMDAIALGSDPPLADTVEMTLRRNRIHQALSKGYELRSQ